MSLEFDRALVFACLAIAVSVVRYGIYLYAIWKGEARPHVFTWFNWGLVVGIGALAQFFLDGGPSAWVLSVVSFTCFFISGIALFRGEKNITRSDWYAFIGVLVAIPVWKLTNDPVYALFVLILIDVLTYYPTIRKSWADPWGEPPLSYVWAGTRYFFALFAVPDPSWETLMYPFFLMIADWGFAAYVFWRRLVLRRHA